MSPKGGDKLPAKLSGKDRPGPRRPGAVQGGLQAGRCDAVRLGLGWLIVGADGKLKVTKTPNGSNPVATGEGTPILGVDVWEHAYYLDFRNVRPNYLDNFLNKLVDWEVVEGLMQQGGLKSGQAA